MFKDNTLDTPSKDQMSSEECCVCVCGGGGLYKHNICTVPCHTMNIVFSERNVCFKTF